jgi:large subunit ribosomal protein L25
MSSDFTLEAETRTDLGKGASRRLRRLENKTLGVVYGGKKKPASLSFAQKDIVKLAESEAFFTSLVDLNLDGKTESVVIKDMQRHPAKDTIMHVDFMRVSAKTKLTMNVPLHFINEDTCPGVKQQGGVVTHAVIDVEIICLPADLPEYIEVDMGEMNMDDNLHLSDVKMPKGVESVALSHGADHDLQIAAIHEPKAAKVEDDAPVEAADGDDAEAADDSADKEGGEE